MRVRYTGDGGVPVIGLKSISVKGVSVSDLDALKEWVKKGKEFEYLEDNEWKELTMDYFEDVNSVETESQDITVLEENTDENVDYSNLFEGHWRTQVKNVKEFSEDYKVIEEILEFAKNSDNVTEAVESRVEEYLEEIS